MILNKLSFVGLAMSPGHQTPAIRRLLTAAAMLLWGGAAMAHDEQRPEDSSPIARDLHEVLATVDGAPIRRGEVRQELLSVLHDRRPEAADEPRLEREMLHQIIRRRLALAALTAEGHAASDEEVDREFAAHREGIERRGEALDKWLTHNGVDAESYRRRLRWDLSWESYRACVLTEQNLREFFDRYRRHFDGTEVRASQILLRSAGSDAEGGGRDGARSAELGTGSAEFGVRSEAADSPDFALPIPHVPLETARKLRVTLEAGEMTFAEAAAKYSIAPSRDQGGDIGFFARRGVMHEAFAAAAFRLRPGEISPPVVTPHGVHLIQVTEEKKGKREFTEVQAEVRRAAEARLFDTLVAGGRRQVRVELAERRNE
jgi:hypothetical protein